MQLKVLFSPIRIIGKPTITFVPMKITLLTIIAFFTALAPTYSQKINLSLTNASLEKTFKEIRKQTGYSFVYTRDQINKANPVSINVKEASLNQVLEICFNGQPLTFKVENKYIIVKDRVQINSPPSTDYLNVAGKVINEKNEPVIGATITVKQSGIATATDEGGRFTLSNLKTDDVLAITSIGYLQADIPLNGKANLVIQLQTYVSRLDETIIIAYGETTRRFSTGSVTKVSSDEISKQPVSNPLAALQGRVPGLVVTSTSGLPGSSFNVQIRGQNSLSSDPSASIFQRDNPLFIIDGVPFAPQNNNINQFASVLSPGNNILLNNSYGGVSPFNTINPEDIESIEILRDADATAIYGSRGANGVILITTKKGKPGKTTFACKLSSGENRVAHTMPMMNTQEYFEMRREAFKNDGIVPNAVLYDPGYAPDLLIYDSIRDRDWKKYFIGNTAHQTDVNASLSGGSSNTTFLLQSGYHDETYIFPGDFEYRRMSVGFNISHTSTDKKLSMELSGNYSYDKNKTSGTPSLLSAFSMEPNYPDLLDKDGNIVWDYKGANLGGIYGIANPMSLLMKTYSVSNYNLISHLQLEYKVFNNLKLRSSFGYNSVNSQEYSGNPASSQNPLFTRNASADFGSVKLSSWIIEPQLEYTKSMRSARLNVLLGGTFQQNSNSSTSISGSGYSSDALLFSISGAPNKTASDASNQYKYAALFGRINYVLKSRYIIDINGRRDGSSRFGKGKQFGNFGSLAAGWIFSETAFLKKKFSCLSYGKIRGSLGTTGSDNIGDYQYISRWAPTNYNYQGSIGYLPQNLFNQQFSWATTKKFEGGIDLGFLQNKLLVTALWYQNRSGNQLVYYPLPNQTGFAGVTQNWSALVQNRGIEFQLNYSISVTKDFNWNTNFNITIPHNQLLSFPGLETSGYATKYIVGKPLSVLNKFKYYGINDTTGIFQFLTANGKISYEPTNINGAKLNDIQVIGDLDPSFYGGWSNTLKFHGFQIDVFVEFKKQLGVNYLSQVYGGTVPGWQSNQPRELLNRWTKPGDKAEFQKFTSQYNNTAVAGLQYFSQSSGVYSDASYIRLKNVSISYDFKKKALQKIKLQNCRIYVNAENLFTITSYKGNDPETQNFYGIPPLRRIATGLQFSF